MFSEGLTATKVFNTGVFLMASPTLLKRSTYPIVDWKNARGKTAEIVVFPPEASLTKGTFLWRLSSATVTEAGPFSAFPGYERYLALVEGKGLRLQFANGGRVLNVKPGEVCQFSGDEPISCELPAGKIADLNLIVQKSTVKAEFKIITLPLKPRSFSLEGKCGFVFGVSGTVVASVYPGETKFQIQEGDTLRVDCPENDPEGERLILLEPGKGDCQVALIELDW